MTTCRFTNEFGDDVPAVDAAEMLAIDRIAIEESGPNLYQMMENAGRHAGGIVVPDHIAPADVLGESDLIIDAIIGYSLRGAPRGRALPMIEWANAVDVPVLSLDIPSGIDATTGDAPGAAVVATRTMTLAVPKHGLCARQAGALELADIGIPREVYRRLGRPDVGLSFNGRYRVPLQRNLGRDD